MEKQEFYKIVAKYNTGKASAAEIEFLEAYYKAFGTRPDFAEKSDDVETGRFWDLMKSEIDQRIEKQVPDKHVKTSRVYKMWPRIAAASILLMLSVSGYFLLNKNTFVSKTNSLVYFSPIGRKITVTLADGTKVILNSGSQLKLSPGFNIKKRDVNLIGEGYFVVAHNAAKPFIVHTDRINIKDVGTEFNVKAYPTDKTTEASLIKGLIEITVNGSMLKHVGQNVIVLSPSRKFIINNQSGEREDISKTVKKSFEVCSITANPSTNTVVETDWKENKLTFYKESMEDIAVQMERWYGVKIVIPNPDIKVSRFTATFDHNDIIQVLEALKLSGNFNYRKEGNVITIY